MTPAEREYIIYGAVVLVILLLAVAGWQFCRHMQKMVVERHERQRWQVTHSDWGFGYQRQPYVYNPDLPGDYTEHHHYGGGYGGHSGYDGDGDCGGDDGDSGGGGDGGGGGD